MRASIIPEQPRETQYGLVRRDRRSVGGGGLSWWCSRGESEADCFALFGADGAEDVGGGSALV